LQFHVTFDLEYCDRSNSLQSLDLFVYESMITLAWPTLAFALTFTTAQGSLESNQIDTVQ